MKPLVLPDPEVWAARGRRLLTAAFALLWLLTVFVAIEAPLSAPVLPLVLGGAGAWVWLLARHERVALYVVLAGSVLVTGYEAGLQVPEVVYGILLVTFVPVWFLRRWLRGTRVVYGGLEGWIVGFTAFALLSGVWSVGFYGATFLEYIGESSLVIPWLLYFPIREWAQDTRRSVAWLWGLVFWFGLVTAVRNAVAYQEALSNAEALWQLVMGRVALAEIYLVDASLGALVLVLHARRWPLRSGLVVVFGICAGALVITQSRGYWVAMLLGIATVFALVNARRRVVLVLTGLGSLVALGGLAYLIAPAEVTVVATGLLQRFTSLGTASTRDLSLVYRFMEARFVAELALENPVIGRGIGAPFTLYRIIEDLTMRKTYVHNGYVSFWYHYGVMGVVPLVVWVMTILRGVRLYRRRDGDVLARLMGLCAAASLTAGLLSAFTSSPVQLGEAWLHLAIWGGFITGSLRRFDAARGEPASA